MFIPASPRRDLIQPPIVMPNTAACGATMATKSRLFDETERESAVAWIYAEMHSTGHSLGFSNEFNLKLRRAPDFWLFLSEVKLKCAVSIVMRTELKFIEASSEERISVAKASRVASFHDSSLRFSPSFGPNSWMKLNTLATDQV